MTGKYRHCEPLLGGVAVSKENWSSETFYTNMAFIIKSQ